jgi:hypothetical protein
MTPARDALASKRRTELREAVRVLKQKGLGI